MDLWDTGCGTHICNTKQGLRASRKPKPGALSLYVGNGQCEAVEAIGNFDLSLPSGLVIVLNNCHYAPSINRGVISVSHLYEDGFINRFVNNTIQVSRNNMVYFSAIPRDGHGIIAHRTPPLHSTTQCQTTLTKSFWDYALETATRILNMVPTKKVEKTPYERVCKLKRSIYGLKQASRQWNKRFDDEIKKFGFTQNADEPCRFNRNLGDLSMDYCKNILKYIQEYIKDMFLVYGGDLNESSGCCLIGRVPSQSIFRYFICTNESGITKGARHFRAKVHYLREVIEFGDIKLEKVHTYDNLADPVTKALAFPKHSKLTRNIGMLPASTLM
ncbi:zinc finger, CCHC-type containing protein [Tanacetum coccineum]